MGGGPGIEVAQSTIIDAPVLGLSEALQLTGFRGYIPPVQPDLPSRMSRKEMMHYLDLFG